MKRTFKSQATRVLAVVLTMSLLMSSMVLGASALIGSVVTSSKVNGVVDYAEYSSTNAHEYVMEFNPKTSNLMPLAYAGWAGGSKTLANQIAAAEADGYTVHGIINGEFFSMASGNAGTLTGRLISNGRVVTDHEGNNEYSFVIDNEGNWNFVQSELAYHLYINGSRVVDVARINKRFNGNWKFDCICYFDSACGTATDTVSSYKGVEVVFDKLNGGELMPESILEGQVVSVNTNTYGTKFTENQFVLTAVAGTAYYDTLAALTKGQKIQIHTEELNADAKEIMKNANSTTAATYPVVKNGVNVTNTGTPSNSSGQLSGTERAQRTAIGVKADGSYVFFVSSGRSSKGYGPGDGLTIKEVGDAMIDLGCVHAVNLDGGGSSTLIAGNNPQTGTKYVTENRAVGSVMLIVSRNDATATPSKKAMVNDWIYNANTTNYASAEQKEQVVAAVNKAQAVYNDSKSMNGDYIRAYMDIQLAMGVTTSVKPKTYISLNANDWNPQATMQVSNDASNNLIFKNTDGQWPFATSYCDVTASVDDVFEFDVTIAGQSSFVLNERNGLKLNTAIAGTNVDAGSGDINGNGKTFKGSMSVSELVDLMAAASQKTDDKLTRADILGADGKLDIDSVRIFAVGSAGAGSQVTVRALGFRSKYAGGDVNGDGSLNSADARQVLLATVGKVTLTDAQKKGADLNGDGDVTAADARLILRKRVGLE